MIGDVSQVGKACQDKDDQSQTGTNAATSATPPKQARTGGKRARAVGMAVDYSQNVAIAYNAVNVHALAKTKRAGYLINELEFNTLRGIQAYVLINTDCGIIQLETFIDTWHRSRKQTKVQGAIQGLITRGYVQLFDQRKNGTRFIGITPLGARLLNVYWLNVGELFSRVVLRRTQTEYSDRAHRFQKVDSAHVGNLYTRSMTTKNRHLYDASKYYNADGSIKS